MKYAHINGAITNDLPGVIQSVAGTTINPTFDQCAKEGWRKVSEIEQPPDGWRVISFAVVDIDGQSCRLKIDKQENISEAEAIRISTPIKYDRPIQARIEVPAVDDHIYGIEIDPETGAVIPVQRESVRLSDSEYKAARDDKLAKRRQLHEKGKAGISGQLQQRIENIERFLGWRND